MRNYWFRILVGALIIFAIGMLGVTLVRRGMVRVNDVVHGSGPISLPIAFIPFEIGGNKLGKLDRVVLERTAPKKISSVRVDVNLDDPLVAQGLSQCKLAANFDASEEHTKGIHIKTGKGQEGTFRCLGASDADSTADSTMVEFGQAVLHPGEVTLPLFLPRDLVSDLQTGNFLSDSSETADSISEAMEALGDSISEAQESKADSLRQRNTQFAESLRTVGLKRVDSIKHAALRLADSVKAATLNGNASRPR
jgi:hypothetical protein